MKINYLGQRVGTPKGSGVITYLGWDFALVKMRGKKRKFTYQTLDDFATYKRLLRKGQHEGLKRKGALYD